MEVLRIVALVLGGSILYGILHDQVTVRVCVEYFTIGHPQIIETSSPALLALAWRIAGTWWVALPLGGLLAACARAGGSLPSKLAARDLLRPLAYLFAAMAALSLVAGFAGNQAARAGILVLLDPLASQVSPELHASFIAALGAHLAAYAVGIVGGLVLCGCVVRRRRRAVSARQS